MQRAITSTVAAQLVAAAEDLVAQSRRAKARASKLVERARTTVAESRVLRAEAAEQRRHETLP